MLRWRSERGKTLRFLAIIIIVGLAIPGLPTVHSALTMRTYRDEAVHNPGVSPSGWSEIGFPVYNGDVLTVAFSTRNGSFDVRVRFGPSLHTTPETIYPYSVTNTTEGSFRYAVPHDGSIIVSSRPWNIGDTVFVYEIRVVPNPTGLSLLPLFG